METFFVCYVINSVSLSFLAELKVKRPCSYNLFKFELIDIPLYNDVILNPEILGFAAAVSDAT